MNNRKSNGSSRISADGAHGDEDMNAEESNQNDGDQVSDERRKPWDRSNEHRTAEALARVGAGGRSSSDCYRGGRRRGLWHRQPKTCRRRVDPKYTDATLRAARIAGAAGLREECAGDRAAGQHAGIHPGADLRANHRLRKGVVQGHRRACAQRANCLR